MDAGAHPGLGRDHDLRLGAARDAHGVKGLWVGDIVSVDAAYNQHKGNWVATQVTLVKRNNSGYISMQDAIEKIAQQRVDQMRQFQTDSPSQQQAWSDASVLDEAQAVAEAAATVGPE
eukprot:1939260-Rhodomonas_salina.1